MNLPTILSWENLLHECLILLTITNTSIIVKQHPKNYFFISLAIYKYSSIISKIQIAKQYQGAADRSEKDQNTVLFRSVSFKLRQSTTVLWQCDCVTYPRAWRSWYLDWWYLLEKCIFIVLPDTRSWMIENKHTISYYIKVSYYFHYFHHIFAEHMIFLQFLILCINLPTILFSIGFTTQMINPS